MDLGRFGSNNVDAKHADKDTAVEDARKLVNSMNDAATGTITSYSPGQGPKRPEVVTCDEIMAKSLVVANEEKAAVIAEKAAVVKAAALLSERIDELTEKLNEANDRVAATELAYTDLEEITQTKLDDAAKEAQDRMTQIKDATSQELERMKLSMSALKNSTAAHIERMETTADEKLYAKDEELHNLRLQNTEELKRIQTRAEEDKVKLLSLHQEDIEALRKEAADAALAHEEEIAEVKATAESEIDSIRQKEAEAESAHKFEIAEVKDDAKSKIAKIEEDAARMMEKIVANANDAMDLEREKHDETRKLLDDKIKEAQEKESALSSSIAELTTESSSLKSEVTFWKDTHNSQGYCNTTLIREDSRKLVLNAIANTKDGISGTQKLLSDGIHGQVQLVQDKSANVVQFIEEEIIPRVEKAMGEACEMALESYNEISSKALVLYNAHLAAAINENIVPMLDEHIYPVWSQMAIPLIDQCTEHVSPIVKSIDEETRKTVTKARAGISPRLESMALSLIKFAQKNNLFNKIPTFLSSLLTQASEDGQWAVDKILRAYLVLIAVLFRSTIFRIIWFFCPLRLFFRRQKSENSKKGNKEAKEKPVKFEQNGAVANGDKKAKIY